MSGKVKQVDCPVCYGGGIPTTFVGRYGERLECPACRGKRKVTEEIGGAFRLIRGELTPWEAGKLLRKTAPDLFPKNWWERLVAVFKKPKEIEQVIGVRFPNENK